MARRELRLDGREALAWIRIAAAANRRRADASMTALPTIGAAAFPLHAESAAEAVLTGPRLEDVLALVERLAPADRARLREELRVRYDASGECEAVSPSQPHRLRQ